MSVCVWGDSSIQSKVDTTFITYNIVRLFMDQRYAGISPKMLQFLKTLELVKRISMKQLIVTAIGKKNNSTYKL